MDCKIARETKGKAKKISYPRYQCKKWKSTNRLLPVNTPYISIYSEELLSSQTNPRCLSCFSIIECSDCGHLLFQGNLDVMDTLYVADHGSDLTKSGAQAHSRKFNETYVVPRRACPNTTFLTYYSSFGDLFSADQIHINICYTVRDQLHLSQGRTERALCQDMVASQNKMRAMSEDNDSSGC